MSGRLTRSPAWRDATLWPTASVARVVATRDSSGIGMAGAGADSVDEALQLCALALVLAGERPRCRSFPWPTTR